MLIRQAADLKGGQGEGHRRFPASQSKVRPRALLRRHSYNPCRNWRTPAAPSLH
jgi:hypothetical protein